MTCAKKEVRCTIVTPDGQEFHGTNDCLNPQKTCPRRPGEGYEKCKSICQQPGHAEEMAVITAREKDALLLGATCTVEGIDNICKLCQRMLYRSGIRELKFK